MSQRETATGIVQTCRFGPYRVSIPERKIWSGERHVHLTPKVFDTLVILLQKRDRVLSKQELLEAVWPDRFVEEANLTQNISVLRRALGETNSATKYIATFPGKGYRFIADVEEEDSEIAVADPVPVTARIPEPPALPPARPRRLRRGVIVGTICLILCAAALWWSRRAVPSPVRFTLGESRALTHLPGRVFQPSITPDGLKAAFVLHDSFAGAHRLGILEIGRNSEPYVLPLGHGDMFSPAWSPDGSALAFLQFDGNRLDLMIRNASGTRRIVGLFPRRYEHIARQLDWSPNGRLLAVSDKNNDEDPFSIALVNIAEHRKIPLTSPPILSEGDLMPRFSPDGKKLAFVRQTARDITPVYLIDLPGGEPKPILPDIHYVGDIDWSPDSAAVYCSTGSATSSHLMRIPVEQSSHGIEYSTPISDGPIQFAISRRSGKLVFGAAEPQQNIWRARIDPVKGVSGWERWVSSVGRNYFPVYSHDGRRLAFLSERTGKAQVWIKNGASEEHQLTFGDLRPSYVSWTGGGDIVFSSLNERRAYRIQPNGGSPIAMPIPAKIGSHTAVSPDGQSIFFVHRFYILGAPIDGGAPRQLTDQGGAPLRLSSDGKWLYYVRNRFSREIWRVNCASGQVERVTNRLEAGFWSAWSLSGNDLVYLAANSDAVPKSLERLDLVTGSVTRFGQLPGRIPPFGMAAFALSPDGRFLLATLAEPGSGDLRVSETAVRKNSGQAEAAIPPIPIVAAALRLLALVSLSR